jgi:NADPH:quinone reductase-like Zn-dependent oxidoreductase
MPAAYVTGPGPAGAIRFGRLPVPVPGPGEVLVGVVASAVNPVDTFVRSGAWPTPLPSPFVIGRDLVGTVAMATHGFAVGDSVWSDSLGHAGRQGTAAGYAVVPADRLYRLPAGVDPVAAVAVLHPAATAWLALFRHARLGAGSASPGGSGGAGGTVFVAGGGGNVGAALIELAAAAGARVVATASARDLEFCRERGAVPTAAGSCWSALRAPDAGQDGVDDPLGEVVLGQLGVPAEGGLEGGGAGEDGQGQLDVQVGAELAGEDAAA